ncbi:MAG: hypothetical protein KC593_13160 [Myxococcales bacterium]|nr:hypothetical protein [Myxococcales bacterium]MCB9629823.1 hypothetical protein [Sandaracinaceae bacterium]
MRAFVRFRLPDGELVELSHGDVIGRLALVALTLDDPRVSEAHALVSLRRGEFVLLGLRGGFAVRGRPVQEAVLRPGMSVEFAPGLVLEVDAVQQPPDVLALEMPGLGRHVLPGVVSLHLGPPPHLAPRFEANAALHVWWNGGTWRARCADADAVDVDAGDELPVGDLRVRFVAVDASGGLTTPNQDAALAAPMRMIVWYDSVEIHRQGHPPLTLGGVGARLMSELLVLEGPVSWHAVAQELWRDGSPEALRHRWDVTLSRLRARLRAAGVRRDLVRHDGAGSVQCVLYPADIIEDRT